MGLGMDRRELGDGLGAGLEGKKDQRKMLSFMLVAVGRRRYPTLWGEGQEQLGEGWSPFWQTQAEVPKAAPRDVQL